MGKITSLGGMRILMIPKKYQQTSFCSVDNIKVMRSDKEKMGCCTRFSRKGNKDFSYGFGVLLLTGKVK